MRTALILSALVLVAGCTKLEDVEDVAADSTATVDAPGDTAAGGEDAMPAPIGTPDSLVGHVWVRTDTSAAAGSIIAFLPTGTVIQTSCVETYRQDPWHTSGEGQVTINEDGMDIPTMFSVDGEALRLTMELSDGDTIVMNYRRSDGALGCPETH